MTAAQLLGLISAALLLQLAAGIGVAAWRRRSAPLALPAGGAVTARADAAWGGWREFRVAQRRFEDTSQSQCSFYLRPVDTQPLPPFKPGQFLTFSLDVASLASEGAGATRAITRSLRRTDSVNVMEFDKAVAMEPRGARSSEVSNTRS